MKRISVPVSAARRGPVRVHQRGGLAF